MSKWQIMVQHERRRGGRHEQVLVKHVKFRPCSDKEFERTGRRFRPLYPRTLRLLFRHARGDGVFKVTLQKRRNGRYMLNLHEPVRLVEKEVRSRSMRWVTVPTGQLVELKESSGATGWCTFFDDVLLGRTRDAEFAEQVRRAFIDAISRLGWPPPAPTDVKRGVGGCSPGP